MLIDQVDLTNSCLLIKCFNVQNKNKKNPNLKMIYFY